jgi:DNA mismatch repair protein MSH4
MNCIIAKNYSKLLANHNAYNFNLTIHLIIARPEFSNTLALKSAYHPILHYASHMEITPNDIYCGSSSSFQLIQGPK